MTDYRTSLIRRFDAFAALAPAWWELWRACPAATPFQSPAWLVAWWRHYAPGDLAAVAVWDDERLVGLAPFYREDGPLGRRLLPVGISLSDYLDVLVHPDEAEAVGAALVEAFRQEAGWGSWEMEELAEDAAAWRLPCPPALTETVRAQSACPVLTLAGGHDFSAVVPARKLRKWRMARNRAARRGTVELRRATPDEAPALLAEVFRLHGARWQDRGEAGLVDETVRRFHEDALPDLLTAGLVRLYGLSLGGRLVGAYYGFMHQGRAYAYLGGFDPDYAFESPGTLLMGHAIEEAAREGAREFHFLRGQEGYKYDWGAVDRWNRCRSFRPANA